jgi:hypothetical protein
MGFGVKQAYCMRCERAKAQVNCKLLKEVTTCGDDC